MDILSQPNGTILKSFNINNAITNATFTWKQVKSVILKKSWKPTPPKKKQ